MAYLYMVDGDMLDADMVAMEEEAAWEDIYDMNTQPSSMIIFHTISLRKKSGTGRMGTHSRNIIQKD